MTNFTAINDRVLVHADLVTKNRVIKGILVFLNQVIDALLWKDTDVVLQVVIAFLRLFGWLLEQLRLLTKNLCLLLAQAVE